MRLDLIRGNLTRGSVDELAFGYVLTDKNNLLGKWEHEAALEHWGGQYCIRVSLRNVLVANVAMFFRQ